MRWVAIRGGLQSCTAHLRAMKSLWATALRLPFRLCCLFLRACVPLRFGTLTGWHVQNKDNDTHAALFKLCLHCLQMSCNSPWLPEKRRHSLQQETFKWFITNSSQSGWMSGGKGKRFQWNRYVKYFSERREVPQKIFCCLMKMASGDVEPAVQKFCVRHLNHFEVLLFSSTCCRHF